MLEDDLDNFSQMGEESIVLFRNAVFPQFFSSLFPHELRRQAMDSIWELIQSSELVELSPASYLSACLDGVYKLPKFMEANLQETLVACRFLAYGDIDYERNMSQQQVNKAKEIALKCMRNELESII